jgi:hypothetical protein
MFLSDIISHYVECNICKTIEELYCGLHSYLYRVIQIGIRAPISFLFLEKSTAIHIYL